MGNKVFSSLTTQVRVYLEESNFSAENKLSDIAAHRSKVANQHTMEYDNPRHISTRSIANHNKINKQGMELHQAAQKSHELAAKHWDKANQPDKAELHRGSAERHQIFVDAHFNQSRPSATRMPIWNLAFGKKSIFYR